VDLHILAQRLVHSWVRQVGLVEEGFAHCTESIVHMVGSVHCMEGFVHTAAVGCTSAVHCTVDRVLDPEVHLAAKEQCWYRVGALD